MPLLGLDFTREHINALFDSFDTDGSGSIHFRELNRLLRKDVQHKRGRDSAKSGGPEQVLL